MKDTKLIQKRQNTKCSHQYGEKEKKMKDFQGRLPIILSFLFVISISAASIYKIRSLTGTPLFYPTIVLIGLYLLWIILEGKTAKKEIGQNQTNIDFGSLEIYALSRATVVLSGLLYPTAFLVFGPLQMAGILLFVAAVTFRLIAIRHLGKFYSHRVRVQEGHQVISDGPYRFVRHPAYVGMIFCHLGFSLFFFNPLTLAIWAFFHVPAVVYRILVEEVALFKIPGYPEYAAKRRRIIPFIW